jgi:DNA-binding LacI/PurR family transcriptional regulator
VNETGRARLVDVAQLAGVSPQTVSNVMNDRPGFTEITRKRVLDAVAKTGYRPNRAAQHLRTRRARQVAFHLTDGQLDVRNPWVVGLLKALVSAADAHEFRVTVLTSVEATHGSFQRDVASRDVDGFILSDSDMSDERTRILAENGVPFAVMGRTPPHLPQSWVDVDDFTAMASVVDHLVARGHTSFGYLGNAGTEYWTTDRRNGVLSRLAHHGIDLPPDRVRSTTPETVTERVQDFLQESDRPTALITGSDSIAIKAVNCAHAAGLTVGRDLAVTGFDGCALEALVDPPLTTVRIPLEAVAEALMDRLVRELEQPTGDPGLILPTTLVVGGSA